MILYSHMKNVVLVIFAGICVLPLQASGPQSPYDLYHQTQSLNSDGLDAAVQTTKAVKNALERLKNTNNTPRRALRSGYGYPGLPSGGQISAESPDYIETKKLSAAKAALETENRQLREQTKTQEDTINIYAQEAGGKIATLQATLAEAEEARDSNGERIHSLEAEQDEVIREYQKQAKAIIDENAALKAQLASAQKTVVVHTAQLKDIGTIRADKEAADAKVRALQAAIDRKAIQESWAEDKDNAHLTLAQEHAKQAIQDRHAAESDRQALIEQLQALQNERDEYKGYLEAAMNHIQSQDNQGPTSASTPATPPNSPASPPTFTSFP